MPLVRTTVCASHTHAFQTCRDLLLCSISTRCLYPPDRCTGGGSGICGDAYAGDRCGICAEGYYHRLDGCAKCSSKAVGITLIAVNAVFLSLLVLAFVYFSDQRLTTAITTISAIQVRAAKGWDSGLPFARRVHCWAWLRRVGGDCGRLQPLSTTPGLCTGMRYSVFFFFLPFPPLDPPPPK